MKINEETPAYHTLFRNYSDIYQGVVLYEAKAYLPSSKMFHYIFLEKGHSGILGDVASLYAQLCNLPTTKSLALATVFLLLRNEEIQTSETNRTHSQSRSLV